MKEIDPASKKHGFYTTKVLVEVTVDTQFGAADAIGLILDSLKCPAVCNIKVVGYDTNEGSDSFDVFIHHEFKG